MKSEIEIADRGFRAAEFRAASLNAESRTVDLIWSTGAPVKRFDWREGEYYLESLDMTAAAVNLDRLNGGAAPFLDNHAHGGMADRLGAVVPGSARIEGGKGIATVVLSTSRSGQQVIDDLAHGLPLPVSVGYSVESYQRTEGEGDELPTLVATRWTPMEISAVLVPADPSAQARNEAAEAQRQTVPVTTNRRADGAADHQESTTMTTSAAGEADTVERKRADTITGLAERYGAPIRLARKAIANGASEAQFREMILDHRRAELDRNPIFSIAPYDNGGGNMPLSAALADAIQGRVDRSFKPSDAARDFLGLTLPEMARRALEARGDGTRGLSAGELVTRALHTTSDFPIALSSVANRLVRAGYDATPGALQPVRALRCPWQRWPPAAWRCGSKQAPMVSWRVSPRSS